MSGSRLSRGTHGCRIERQAEADRRVAGDEEAVIAAEVPRARSSTCSPASRSEGRAPTTLSSPTVNRRRRRSRSSGSSSFASCGSTFTGSRALAPQVVVGVLVRGEDVLRRRDRAPSRRRGASGPRSPRRRRSASASSAMSEASLPERLAVATPVQVERPARQRLAGVPLALSEMDEPLRRVLLAQAAMESRSRASSCSGRARRCSTRRRRGSSIETNVGSPPIVRRTSAAASSASTVLPSATIASHCASRVRLRDARHLEHARDAHRVLEVVSHASTSPLTGAASAGSAVHASGRWPSPASRPDVGSSPIQPAPGR